MRTGDSKKPRQCAAYRDVMWVGDSLWGLTQYSEFTSKIAI